jgi:hypothetical protein
MAFAAGSFRAVSGNFVDQVWPHGGLSTKHETSLDTNYLFQPFSVPSLELCKEIIATYQRHGWELKRVLVKPATRKDLSEQDPAVFNEAGLSEAEFDALWFARPSPGGREVWELRLLAQHPYALFAAFESDETEEEREEARLEMEHQMRDQVGPKSEPPAVAGG